MNPSSSRNLREIALGLALSGALALGTSGCGGSGGSSTGSTLPGVVLVDFHQAGEDNLPLNRILQFDFSSAIDPDSVGYSSIQIRQGPAFGLSVEGRYAVQGSTVYFEPKLPGLCTLTDGGFKPDTDYHVTLIGSPEEFSIRNLAGTPLQATVNSAFHTRIDTDPNLFEDEVPGSNPSVIGTTPVDGAWPDAPSAGASTFPEVYIGAGNKVVIDFSENIDPCSISQDTVTFYQYATGDQPTMPNGFLPGGDVTPGDPFTWGSGTATSPPRRVRSNYLLSQTFLSTRLEITPVFGEFPDNALLVVQATNLVRDFGGHPLLPKNFAFVTENRPAQNNTHVFEFVGETPIDTNLTTADVNTPRAVSKVQGYVLFAGDGDNGAVITRASGPDNSRGPTGCLTPPGIPQANDAIPDDFDPLSDVVLDTGSTVNTCRNSTDGSTATVFEFRTFRIRNGVTVRLVGVNPAIILVQGDALIETGGKLLARGDGVGGTAQANGTVGVKNATNNAPGGTGVAGGRNGGDAPTGYGSSTVSTSQAGTQGYYAQPLGTIAADVGTIGGAGAGHGNISVFWTQQINPDNRNGTGGGGGGHATAGGTGDSAGAGSSPTTLDGAVDGTGGSTYGDSSGKLPNPEAGSGGGGAGAVRTTYITSGAGCGGGGGAGGGFVDLTAKGNITVFGTIDASGGRGGAGASGTVYAWEVGSAGGGGGSGGGIRLLTPKSIQLGAQAVVTAAGGQGGVGGVAQASPAVPVNNGGVGGSGRIVFEDGDSVITGYASAVVVPPDGAVGFFRGVFDSTRFQGGGLTPQMTTALIDVGPTTPTFSPPVQNYAGQQDFITSIPLVSTRGINAPSIFLEVQGFPANPDGTANLLAGTGWKSVGYMKDSGAEFSPTWVPGTPVVGILPTAPPDGQVPVLPTGNTGGSIADINGKEFIKFRMTFYLKPGMGAFDPGPYIDRWTLHYAYDQ